MNNIIEANTTYLHQQSLINTYMLMDSLRTNQLKMTTTSLSYCKMQNSGLDKVIQMKDEHISDLENIVQSQHRIITAGGSLGVILLLLTLIF